MSKKLYTYTQLKILNTVLDEGSHTAAAKSLNLSQPAVSQAISKLEANLNLQLFHQRGRHVVPTSFCLKLGAITHQMLTMEANLNTLLQRGLSLETGVLKVGLCNAMPGMKLLKSFNIIFPKILIEVYFGNYQETFSRVIENHVDIGILANVPNDERLITKKCACQRLVALCSANHKLATKQSIDLQELTTEKIIFRTKGSTTQKIVDEALRKSGVTITPSYMLNTQQSVYDAVYHNLGIGFAWSESTVRQEGCIKIPIEEINTVYSEIVFGLKNNSNKVVTAFM